jgi:hypothetical protein
VVDSRLEVPSQTSGKTALSQTGSTESGTLAAQLAQYDADLQVVIDAWPSLSESTKQAILAMVHQCALSDERDGVTVSEE